LFEKVVNKVYFYQEPKQNDLLVFENNFQSFFMISSYAMAVRVAIYSRTPFPSTILSIKTLFLLSA